MDLQTSLLCLVLVLFSGAILFFISFYGIKEKTYEEAIAEQRKMPEDELLLQTFKNEKSRNKKKKKEKVKKKLIVSKFNRPVSNEINSTSIPLSGPKIKLEKKENKNNVNFLKPKVVKKGISTDMSNNIKKKEKDSMNIVLINKKAPYNVQMKPNENELPSNNFTGVVPKDDMQSKVKSDKNNANSKKMNKVQSNLKKNFDIKEPKINWKANKSQSFLKDINNTAENEKNRKIVSDVYKGSEKPKEKKAQYDQLKEELKNDKLKKNKTKMENNVNNDKIKNENHQIIQKSKLDQKQVKPNVNEKGSDASFEKKYVQMKKNCNQQLKLNNKDQKNKKNKNHETFSLQQMVEKDTININLLLPLIRKAELSRSEVQTLTDILLTSHSDEKPDGFEWVEGRQDPVVKLKKQLAEKEKALVDEQQACQAFQNKLKELRSEYNSERARLTQACRQYDETILAKQGEIQNLHATNRHLIDNHMGEKQVLTQKIQQLQAQISDENIVIRKLQEDHNQTQNALQQELINQRQQMEMHIGRLSEQLQETQKNFEAQIHNKIQEAEQLKVSLNAELQKNRRQEEELRELREQQIQNQNKIKSLESRASQLKETNNHTQELVRQVEELQRINKDLEIRLNNSLKIEEELQFEKIKLQSEGHNFRNTILQLQNECGSLRKECEKLEKNQDKMKAAKDDIENNFVKVKEENQCLISQVSSFAKVEREAQRLREENENLAAQVTAFTERPAADGRENGDFFYNETENKSENINIAFINHENEKQNNVVVENLLKELQQKELILEELRIEKEQCNSEIKRLLLNAATFKKDIQDLRDELETQRDKNNDLRKKNWKAMEVLATTEKALEDSQNKAENKVQVRVKECEEVFKNVLAKIFPFIKINEKDLKNWILEFENCAKNYLEQLTKETEKRSSKEVSLAVDLNLVEELETKNNQLLTSIAYYKTIIEDTESMLKKLQNHIEQEEIRWRQQCDSLQMQIEVFKSKLEIVESSNERLQSKIKEMENDGMSETTSMEQIKKFQKCNKFFNDINKEISYVELLEENEKKNKEKEVNKKFSEDAQFHEIIKYKPNTFDEKNKRTMELEDELMSLKNENINDSSITSSEDFVVFEKLSVTDHSLN